MENYKFNPVSKTLIVSATFEKAMNDPISEEYRLYIQLQHDIPGLKVARRTHKSPARYHNKSGDVRKRLIIPPKKESEDLIRGPQRV